MGICNIKILYMSCDTLKDGCLCKCLDDCGGFFVRNCLLSSPVKVLKIFKFGEICGDDENIEEQIEHFLKTTPNLEQMILC
ncbi:unnamed protein product [Arabidopsis halleri]